MNAPSKTILVTGDLILDHHLYEGERPSPGENCGRGVHEHVEWAGAPLIERLISCYEQEPTVKERRKQRNESIDARLAFGSLPDPNPTAYLQDVRKSILGNGKNKPLADTLDRHAAQIAQSARGYALFRPFAKGPTHKEKVWRVSKPLGYGPARRIAVPEDVDHGALTLQANQTLTPTPSVVVIDDAGCAFRHMTSNHGRDPEIWCLPPLKLKQKPWILLKTPGAFEGGGLYERLSTREDLSSHLVVLVSAHQLRLQNIRLSRGLSWERSAEHLLSELSVNPALNGISSSARGLVVNFGIEGAVWIDFTSRTAPKAFLVFDSAHAEGEWSGRVEGSAFSYQSCMAASICLSLVELESNADVSAALVGEALSRGLGAMRRLHEDGHGRVLAANGELQIPSGFPVAAVSREMAHPSHTFAIASIPSEVWRSFDSDSGGTQWTILGQTQYQTDKPAAASEPARPLFGLARQLVVHGEIALASIPHLRIGQLLTADREDMESLRSLRRLLTAYADKSNPGSKPLSLGVFGAPGSGKSFGVKQLAIGIFGEPGAKEYRGWLEFNLSQFNERDLLGAFHQVRDLVLQGLIPVVFWDEFDTGNYRWLQYLLAPMQDGKFQEGPLTHTLGKCVFIFAGGTAWRFEAFGAFEDDDRLKHFALAKGPDFTSRLDGYYNVLGPNQRYLPPFVADSDNKTEIGHRAWATPNEKWEPDLTDIFYPIRRALIIRAQFKCGPSDRIDFDPGLLTALLQTEKYVHGARSLEKVLEPLRSQRNLLAQPRPPVRANLPAPNQMKLHVADPMQFHRLCRDHQPDPFRDKKKLDVLARAIHGFWAKGIRSSDQFNPNNVGWDDLSDDAKSSNFAAAYRIPDILAMAGLTLKGGAETPEHREIINEHIELHLDLLAEAEHDGWMQNRKANRWTYDPVRDDGQRKHPCLKPFAELSKVEQDKDRNTVRNYPNFVSLVGLTIQFIDPLSKQNEPLQPATPRVTTPKRTPKRNRRK